ncbi:hypothetical protein HDU88_004765 [Geranomyces variabilis]|nr:hypothetical protein HDU88_004765 [Geranomyces variabilis]
MPLRSISSILALVALLAYPTSAAISCSGNDVSSQITLCYTTATKTCVPINTRNGTAPLGSYLTMFINSAFITDSSEVIEGQLGIHIIGTLDSISLSSPHSPVPYTVTGSHISGFGTGGKQIPSRIANYKSLHNITDANAAVPFIGAFLEVHGSWSEMSPTIEVVDDDQLTLSNISIPLSDSRRAYLYGEWIWQKPRGLIENATESTDWLLMFARSQSCAYGRAKVLLFLAAAIPAASAQHQQHTPTGSTTTTALKWGFEQNTLLACRFVTAAGCMAGAFACVKQTTEMVPCIMAGAGCSTVFASYCGDMPRAAECPQSPLPKEPLA